MYRHTSFYCASLYSTSQILCFLQIEALCQLCIEQVYQCLFPIAFAHFCLCVSYFGSSHNIANFVIFIDLFW